MPNDIQTPEWLSQLWKSVLCDSSYALMQLEDATVKLDLDPDNFVAKGELNVHIAYAVAALDYLISVGYKLPRFMPPRIVHSNARTIELLRLKLAEGWKPIHYEIMAHLLFSHGFVTSQDLPPSYVAACEKALAVALEAYEINNGWIESV